MVKQIQEAVSLKISEIFGAEYAIYMEDIPQPAASPCFTIILENAFRKPLLGTRAKMEYGFLIHYIPVSETTPKAECNETAAQLMDNLEFVTDSSGDIYHGTKLQYEITDNILNFRLNYNVIIYKPTEEVKMEEFSSRTDLGQER